MGSQTELDELRREKEALLARIPSLGNLMHGSYFSRHLVCSRPGCKCHSGEKHGPVMCLGVVYEGRQRQQYVPKSLEGEAVAAVDAYNQVLAILDRVSDINLQLFRAKAPGRGVKRSHASAREARK